MVSILPNKAFYKLFLYDPLQNLRTRLDTNLLQPVLTPIRLQGGEEQEEITEDTDVEDMLRTLAASEMIAPGK